VNSRSDHGHEDSTINIVVDYYYYYYLLMILIRPCIPVFRWDTGTTYITLESDDCRFAVSHIVTHDYAASH